MGRTIAVFLLLFSLVARAQSDRDALLQSIDAKRSAYTDIAKQMTLESF